MMIHNPMSKKMMAVILVRDRYRLLRFYITNCPEETMDQFYQKRMDFNQEDGRLLHTLILSQFDRRTLMSPELEYFGPPKDIQMSSSTFVVPYKCIEFDPHQDYVAYQRFLNEHAPSEGDVLVKWRELSWREKQVYYIN
jgi:hypothetical protein